MGNKPGADIIELNEDEGNDEVKCEKIKILIMGPKTSGKSCIFKRYLRGSFSSEYKPDATGTYVFLFLIMFSDKSNNKVLSPHLFSCNSKRWM